MGKCWYQFFVNICVKIANMNSQFETFLKLGFEHISDINGYDHILFIVTLCCMYHYSHWKKVSVLVTAFTVGHSVTLALSALKIIISNSYLIELLIPVTILLTAIYNIWGVKREHKITWISYVMTLAFGFIHGLGFSNFFNSIFGDGLSVLNTLLAFNIGLEIGQLLIVCLFFVLLYVLIHFGKISHKTIIYTCCTISSILSTLMIIERL